MAKGIEAELRQIEADEEKLRQRRARLAEQERAEVQKRLEKSPLAKLSLAQTEVLLGRVKALGVDEVLKRLA